MSETKKAEASPSWGIGEVEWILYGVLLVGLYAIFKKLQAQGVTTGQIMLLRYGGQLGIGFLYGLWKTGNLGFVRPKFPGLIIARGVAVFFAAACVVKAQGLLPVTVATAVGFLWPPVFALLAVIVLKEQFTPRLRWQLALCVAGVFVTSGMTLEAMFSAGILWSLGAVISNSVNALLAKMALNKQESPYTGVLWTGLTGLAVVLVWWLVQPSVFGSMPSDVGLVLPVTLVVVAGLAQVLLTTAFKSAKSTAGLMPLTYVQLAWAVPLDILVFGKYPGWLKIIGILLILAGAGLEYWIKLSAKPRSRLRQWFSREAAN